MPCGWEGNRGSGVVLAMRHRAMVYPPVWAHPLKPIESEMRTPPTLLTGHGKT